MRREIIEFAKTITGDTPLTEIFKVVRSEEELMYLLKIIGVEIHE